MDPFSREAIHMQNANTLEAMEVARQLILVLKGTVESLQMNLSLDRY